MAYQYLNMNVKNPETGEQGMWYYTGMTATQIAVATESGGGTYREVEGEVPDTSDPTADNTKAIQQIKAAYSDDYPSKPVDPGSGMVGVIAQTAAYGDLGEVLAAPKEVTIPPSAIVLPEIKPSWAWLGIAAVAALLLMPKWKGAKA